MVEIRAKEDCFESPQTFPPHTCRIGVVDHVLRYSTLGGELASELSEHCSFEVCEILESLLDSISYDVMVEYPVFHHALLMELADHSLQWGFHDLISRIMEHFWGLSSESYHDFVVDCLDAPRLLQQTHPSCLDCYLSTIAFAKCPCTFEIFLLAAFSFFLLVPSEGFQPWSEFLVHQVQERAVAVPILLVDPAQAAKI